jgi:hypothetical protein
MPELSKNSLGTPDEKKAFAEWLRSQQAEAHWFLGQLDILDR